MHQLKNVFILIFQITGYDFVHTKAYIKFFAEFTCFLTKFSPLFYEFRVTERLTFKQRRQQTFTCPKSTRKTLVNRKMCEVCSNLTIMAPERSQWLRFGAFIGNFEHIWHCFLVFQSFVGTCKCLLEREYLTISLS